MTGDAWVCIRNELGMRAPDRLRVSCRSVASLSGRVASWLAGRSGIFLPGPCPEGARAEWTGRDTGHLLRHLVVSPGLFLIRPDVPDVHCRNLASWSPGRPCTDLTMTFQPTTALSSAGQDPCRTVAIYGCFPQRAPSAEMGHPVSALVPECGGLRPGRLPGETTGCWNSLLQNRQSR